MNILYVYSHPNPFSFNGMLKDLALNSLKKQEQKVIVSDLYSEKFNAAASWQDFMLPEPQDRAQYFLAQKDAFQNHTLAKDIQNEIEKMNAADHIFLQFPLWWFTVPAILKGWLDRVLVKGFAYDAGKLFENGLLKGKTASLIVTTQSPASAFQPGAMHGANINAFLLSIHHTFRFVGIEPLDPFVAFGAFNLTDDQESQIKLDFQGYLEKIINVH